MEHISKIDYSPRIFNLSFERCTLPQRVLTRSQYQTTVEEFQYHRQFLKQNNNIDFLLPETFGFEGTSRGDYYYTGLHTYLESSQSVRPEISPSSDLPLAKFCAVTSTGYVITQKYRKVGKRIPVNYLNDHLFHLVLENEDMNMRIYQVLSSLPRTYLTHCWRWVGSHNDILNSIVSPEATNFDPFSCTALERAKGETSSASVPQASMNENTDEVIVIKSNCNQMSVKVKTSQDGYLIVADQFYPGWHAYVDAKPARIYAANGFNRAVALKAGEHIVEFKYEPESLELGCILAALGCLLTGYLFWLDHRQKGSAIMLKE
jgi:hypothetical protein